MNINQLSDSVTSLAKEATTLDWKRSFLCIMNSCPVVEARVELILFVWCVVMCKQLSVNLLGLVLIAR